MPKPPILPSIDWAQIHASGVDWDAWLAQAENDEHRSRMIESAAIASDAPTSAALAALSRTVNVVAIAEDWCGDVVRHAPVLQRMAAASAGRLALRFITREQHPDVFVRFLTNGGEAIPKFVFISEDWVECGNWGPMPAGDRALIARGKAAGDVASARTAIKLRYEADPRCRIVERELLELALTAGAEVV